MAALCDTECDAKLDSGQQPCRQHATPSPFHIAGEAIEGVAGLRGAFPRQDHQGKTPVSSLELRVFAKAQADAKGWGC